MAVTTVSSLSESFTSAVPISSEESTLSKGNGDLVDALMVELPQQDKFSSSLVGDHALQADVKVPANNQGILATDSARGIGQQGEDGSEESDCDGILEVHD